MLEGESKILSRVKKPIRGREKHYPVYANKKHFISLNTLSTHCQQEGWHDSNTQLWNIDRGPVHRKVLLLVGTAPIYINAV